MFEERGFVEASEASVRRLVVTAREVVLQDFLLRRADGVEDGHIGQVGMVQQGRLPTGSIPYGVAFADDDADEAGRGAFRWIVLDPLGSAVSTVQLVGRTILDSSTLGLGMLLGERVQLLGGFYFARQRGLDQQFAGDHHLREIAVLPTTRGGYSVTFRDDSPGNDRYTCWVDVVLVPSATVVSRHSRRFEEAVGSVDVPREPGQAALCGFSFKYKDSDHHIRHLEVRLADDRIRMAMRDNDRNRRFEAAVEYALIQD